MMVGGAWSGSGWVLRHCRFDKFSFHFGVDSTGGLGEAKAVAGLEILNTVGFELKASLRPPLWYTIGRQSSIKLAYV